MSQETPINVEKRLVTELREQLASRNQRWMDARMRHHEEINQANQVLLNSQNALQSELTASRAEIENEYSSAAKEIETEYSSVVSSAQQQYNRRAREIANAFDATTTASQKKFEDTSWMVSSVLDEDSEDSPKRKLDDLRASLQKGREHLTDGVESLASDLTEAQRELARRRQRYEESYPEVEPAPTDPEAAYEACQKAVSTGRGQLLKLRKDLLPRLFIGQLPIVLFTVSIVLLSLIAFFLLPPTLLGASVEQFSAAWIATCAGVSLGLTVVVMVILYAVAGQRCDAAYRTMLDSFATAELALHNWRTWSDRELRKKQRQFEKWHNARIEQRDKTVAQAEAQHNQVVAEATQKRDNDQQQIESELAKQVEQAEQNRAAKLERITARRDAALMTLTGREQLDPQTLQDSHQTTREQAEHELTARESAIKNEWDHFWANCLATETELNQRATACILSAEALEGGGWSLPTNVPEGIPIGHFDLQVQTAIETEGTRSSRPTTMRFPVVLPFDKGPSLFMRTSGAGRAVANDTLRAVMLRILTSLPAGKVRFTIIDPVGLGEQFSTFMHLADHDELLVNSRIWTEGNHIEQRLADLTEHMENVFQTYLRNEYKSIEEYNEFAGEVAEPYHFLVIADFPANFSEIAARRLVSIVNSGARCGVNTLISYDESRALPHGSKLEDFLGGATELVWRDDHFEQADEELAGLPVSLDPPLESAEFTKVVRRAGELSKDARRVEVAFDRIAPAEGDLWRSDSRSGIDVPLGRAGATKLQHLQLGRGTSQHVLVAGKTGSGKSTFLHALITNTALHYGPDEVELYLVDFKKGVEFKAYANGHLPHARVIAIESDREFGVSVLQRLDAVLSERGELFRERGVQDIEMFRNASPDERMPRIMLLVDEFQEFFTEDDKLSQTASLLLDRLVRQGRAFGIHVLLGSQTLGGAYSLARSTLGQVAVRIALQCSESDAHLILSEDNTAARLLTRPGEAIYNDANGLIDGNHPFQIAWLGDEQRVEKLQRIYNLTLRRGLQPQPPVVFEGNIPSDPENNVEINELIQAFPPATAPARGRVWLGEPVELKAATAIELERQAGNNLLIAGQGIDSVLGIMTTCLRTLGYQYPRPDNEADAKARFYVLDAIAAEHNSRGLWSQAVNATGHQVTVGGPSKSAEIVAELAAEVDRRLDSNAENAPAVYFFVANLTGFRDLRRDEDDFGSWGMDDDKQASPSKQFAKILTDGPALGVHTFMWCDSYNTVSRWLGNKLMRELEYRVCFRMNANDSSQIIDTPAAGRLGPNRALLYRDSTGETEKFRPYGVLLDPTSARPASKKSDDTEAEDGNWDSMEMFSVQ